MTIDIISYAGVFLAGISTGVAVGRWLNEIERLIKILEDQEHKNKKDRP